MEYSDPETGSFTDPVTGEPFSNYFYSKLSFSNDRTTGTITLASGTILTIDEKYDNTVLTLSTSEFDTEAGTLNITNSDGTSIDVTFDSEGDGNGPINKDGSKIGTVYFSYYEYVDEDGIPDEEDVVYYTLDSEDNKIPHTVPLEFLP